MELAEFVLEHLDLPPETVRYYSDSKIVLGYIHNESRRFYVYVSNRVQRIRKSSRPEQWNHVRSEFNPADIGTRSVPANQLNTSAWLLGPSFLINPPESAQTCYPLMDVDDDTEVRPSVTVLKTDISKTRSIGAVRFERFSSWRGLVRAIACLKSFIKRRHGQRSGEAVDYKDAENWIIREVQREVYAAELKKIKKAEPLPRDSPILNLNPVLDEEGLLRVGGRLNRSNIPLEGRNPIIIPKRHHIATLLVRHYHDSIQHQGRHFTEGAIRAAGFWIVSGKRLIASLLHDCVQCRKLRGKPACQKMADLPVDRLTPSPPFSSVGVDTFGPWEVVARRTRGGHANSKRWTILFTCLSTRAIHLEVIEQMTSSSFINAVRRFISIRGKVSEFRSDRGTNFVGAIEDLQMTAINVEDGQVKQFLNNSGSKWIFNPPHSSHMGGVWERMIGITRRILDNMLSNTRTLTHEVLVTLMAEVSAIVNARPIVPVSSDPESPFILSPATLLTHKTDHATDQSGKHDMKDLYRAQWKQVQVLADTFWNRWRREYLTTLQTRRKWQNELPNIKNGDVVLLTDKSTSRNRWPAGIIVNAIPGDDGMVRKAEVKVFKDGSTATYTRPITEMVLLLSNEASK